LEDIRTNGSTHKIGKVRPPKIPVQEINGDCRRKGYI
jgi:hypothetical protein